MTTSFRGPVYFPSDPEYGALSLDARPAIVAAATCASDVQAAVLNAREIGVPFAVQATGHGTLVPADGGLLLKTGALNRVLVDPARRTARVGPGARWGDVIAAAAPFGLAPLSGTSPDVGVAGYTLGGGFSWLSRRFGFAADSPLRADVVTADGRHLTASEELHPELLWALRGGGGNFGVVTALELRLHPVPEVYAGAALFPRARAAETLARLREVALPDELNVAVVLRPDALVVRGVYAGAEDAGRRALRPLLRAAGTPLRSDWRSRSYAETGTIGGTAPRRFERLDDLPIDALLAVAERAAAVEVRQWGGAMARPGGPVGHRDVPFAVTIDGDEQAAAPLAPHATGASFLNFLKETTRTRAAYSPRDYERLRAIKAVYDPDNVLGLSHNIPPASTVQELAA